MLHLCADMKMASQSKSVAIITTTGTRISAGKVFDAILSPETVNSRHQGEVQEI